MRLSEKGRKFIQQWEGLRLRAYRPLPTDVYTIGWGHTLTAVEGMKVTPQEAEILFISDVAEFEKCVTRGVPVGLSQDQFDALVSLAFNIGCRAFLRSTLLRELKAGHYDRVPQQIRRWNRSGGKVVRGLVARREAEATLWTEPTATLASNTRPDIPKGKRVGSILKESKTAKASGAIGVMAIADQASILSGQAATVADNVGFSSSSMFGVGIIAIVGYLIYNRWRDSDMGRAY